MWLPFENEKAWPSLFPLSKMRPTYLPGAKWETRNKQKKNNYNLTPRLTNRVKWTLDNLPGRRGQLKQGEKKIYKMERKHSDPPPHFREQCESGRLFSALSWNWTWQKSSHLSFVWVDIVFCVPFLTRVLRPEIPRVDRGRSETLIKTLQKKRLLDVQNFILFRGFFWDMTRWRAFFGEWENKQFPVR